MENLEVLIFESFFLGLTSLRKARQSISCNISLSQIIIDTKVVSRELLRLADLIRAQTLCIYESAEVIMVNKDKNLIFAIF